MIGECGTEYGMDPAIELCNFPRLVKKAVMVYIWPSGVAITPKSTGRLCKILGW